MKRAFLILPILILSACGQGRDDKAAADGADITINADGDDGKVKITSGSDGSKLAIKGDGVNINMDLPDFGKMDISSDFDIDGVNLYPGTKISSLNVDASDKQGADKAIVRVSFSSPATPAKAADWMAAEFAKQDTQVTRKGDTLAGKTEDGDDFTIRFDPAGTISKGEVLIVSKQ